MLIIALMYSDPEVLEKVKHILIEEFQDIKAESKPYLFDQFTNYYEKEMGKNLQKEFLIFKKQVKKQDLIRIKHKTTEIEKKFAVNNNRVINLDPGYINQEELVLASFKKGTNYKENLGEEVYAHKVIRFKDREPTIFWHTFPDYREKENQEFFIQNLI